jgi:NADH-ubiquinone oxidoreductase chain 6
MNKLYFITETSTNGYAVNTLNFLSLFIIFMAICIITFKNPVVSILFLIGLFGTVSCYLIFTGLNFIGLSYLIIYVGAVSILFLFILMLINIRISELKSNTNNSIPLTILLGAFLSYSLFQYLPYNIAVLNNFDSLLTKLFYSFGSEAMQTTNENNNEIFKNILALQNKNVIYFVTSKT